MKKDHYKNSHNYQHCPELDIIMGKKQNIIGKWALPIMLAMAAIAIAAFVYTYIRMSNL